MGVRIDPKHSIQVNGGLIDFWYLDDGDILCDPSLVLPYLEAFDRLNPSIGGVRNVAKTEVLYYASQDDLDQHGVAWQVERISTLAAVSLASVGTLTLGVVTGPATAVADQLLQKTKVVQAMHERVQLCQDAQTEFVLARQSLGVSRVNHILRVHGHAAVVSSSAGQAFDEVTQASLERLFPGVTQEGHEQSSLCMNQGGLGWRKILDVARPAHLGALVASGPRLKSMIQAAGVAGLLPVDRLEARLAQWARAAKDALLDSLDEVEKVRAEDFLGRAEVAADAAWQRLQVRLDGK